MVGIYAAVSTLNHMAPWGGAEALMGTNPIAIAIPAGKEAPVVLDIATSVSSFGNIRQHLARGEPLQEGWVVHSKTGEPITDPKKVGEGVLLPIGGHKGSGLALMIGLLAGVLNGAAFGREVVDPIGARQRRRPTPGSSSSRSTCRASSRRRFSPPRWTGTSRICASSPTLPGFDSIRLPGADRRKRRADRSANGVQLPPALVKQLDEMAAKLEDRSRLRRASYALRARLRSSYLLFPSTQARTCGSTSGSSASTCARVMPGRMRRS